MAQDKTSVRARMEATGEPYDVARRNVLAERGVAVDDEPLPAGPGPATEAWRSVQWCAPASGANEPTGCLCPHDLMPDGTLIPDGVIAIGCPVHDLEQEADHG